MVLILSDSDVAKLLSMQDGIHAIESAFRDYAQDSAILLPRISQNLPGTSGAFRIMAAVLPRSGWFGLKTLTGYPGQRQPGETYFALLLFEMKTGALRSVIAGNHLTAVRTGAATGVAAKYLARENAKVLGIIGAGVQARQQVAAIVAVRPVTLVKVFDIDAPKAFAFAEWIQTTFSIEARAVGEPRQIAQGSDMVVTVTTAREPVLYREWLEPGTHLSGVGANTPAKCELDAACFRGSKLVVDFPKQVLEEGGDLRAALSSGAITQDDIYAALDEIVTGKKPGRQDPQELTVFKSVGVAIEDIATAALVYERAVTNGVGLSVQLEQDSEPEVVAAANLS